MEASQFETLILAVTGLRTEMKSEFNRLESKMDIGFTEVRNEMDTGFAKVRREMDAGFAEVRKEMDTGFAEVREDIKSMREQVARTHVGVTELKTRVSKLEIPRA